MKVLTKRKSSDQDFNTNAVSNSRVNGMGAPDISPFRYVPIRLTLAYWLILLGVLFFLKLSLHELNSSCDFYVDVPVNDSEKGNALIFSEELARTHIREVTKFGARPTGTDENEIHTPKYLKSVFRQLKASVEKNDHPYKVFIDEHISQQGSFTMDFLHNRAMSSVYRNVRNLLLRLHDSRFDVEYSDGRQFSNSSILINCHYDSVIDSPGATDDFISCALMLEIARVLTIQKVPLANDLIFLFNGAEENLLQASHAFVTQHPWFKDVRSFVNMEGAGAAGKLFLFQAGPNAPWLVEEFSSSVARPFASILGMEVFQSGLIPGDTDFRIFRDYGGIPGLDLAFIQNGFIYHTIYDEEKRIPPACLKLAGINVVSFLQKLAQSSYVAHPTDYHGGDVIFFDVLGFFMIRYHATFSAILNNSLVVLVIYEFYCYIQAITLQYSGQRKREILYLLMKAACNHILGILFGTFCLLIIIFLMTVMGKYLSWYAHRYNLLGLYVLPFLWSFFTFHSQISPRIFSWSKLSLEQIEEAHHLVAQIFLAVIVLVCTMLRIYSAYIFVIWLAFSLIGRRVFTFCLIHTPLKHLSGEILFIFYRLLFYSIPMIYHINRIWGVHEVFIPIMGRAGSAVNPDLFLVMVTLIFSLIFPLFLAGDVFITKVGSVKKIRFFLFHMSLSFILCILFTDLGFPYNSSSIAPRKQRIGLVHFRRTFHDLETDERSLKDVEDSGIWTFPLDINGKALLEKELHEYLDLQPIPCEKRPYCGMPHHYPLISNFPSSYVLPVSSPTSQLPTPKLIVLSKDFLSTTLINVTLSIDGPPHNHIFLMTPEPEKVALHSWSIAPTDQRPTATAMPKQASGNHYFIYNGYGEAPGSPLLIWFVFQLSATLQPTEKAIVEVALSAQYLSNKTKSSPELQKLLSSLPQWVVPTSWAAVYENWQIDVRAR